MSTSSPTPLRRTRRDLIATGVIAAVAAVLAGGAWFTAPVRSAHLEPAVVPHESAAEPDVVPAGLVEVFTAEGSALPGVHRPVVAGGLTIAHDRHTVRALDETGAQVWSYSRKDREICSLGQAWDKVVVTYRSGVGCGDVIGLEADSGQHAGSRSAIAEETPAAVSSNDRVGIVGPDRVELWRSDLVRTVEYGEVEAKQEPGLQPHEQCTITSALTRTELLAVTEVCPDDPDVTMLRLQDASPEESRAPELHASVPLASADARLVSVGQDAAAVYLPSAPGSSGTTGASGTSDPSAGAAHLVSFDKSGAELSRTPIDPAPAGEGADSLAPVSADLPHHMTWFDGNNLYLLRPDTLAVANVVPEVLGTGVAAGEHLLVPVPEGIAVVDWTTATIERVIDVDRGAHTGEVHLATAGGIFVERRGESLVGLAPTT